LEPSSAERPRRAYLHLPRSTTSRNSSYLKLPSAFVTHPSSHDGVIDRRDVVAYSLRHTYAQRHADVGTPVDVLAALLDHRNVAVTQGITASVRNGNGKRSNASGRW
jgi:integrase